METDYTERVGDEAGRVTTALLLAAGTGSRLRPLTDEMPKCLTEVNGKAILQQQIDCLRQCGFKRLVVVLGYLGDRIREFLDSRAEGLSIDYVVNPYYRTTNNIYSLWLAREKVRQSLLLLECDLFFEPSLLNGLLYPDKIAISRILPWMNGSTVAIDRCQRVTDFQVGARAASDGFRYKTVNIYSLSRSSWRAVAEGLERRICRYGANEYYETVFAEMVADGSLSLEPVFFDEGCWYEVDTLADLDEAERIFSGGFGPAASGLVAKHG